ncbi:MAG: glycosyltransferase family 4 protein [Anaerolineae bacterium]|nr:glycosyltransferase family 4 protein [Anaerolineae bacterium]
MRILFLADFIPPYEIGGGGKIPWRLAQGFLERGHEVHMISSTPQPGYHEVRDEIPIHYLHSSYPERWRAWLSVYNPPVLRPLRDLLDAIRPEVVNVHNIHTHLSYASLRLAHRMGLPVVFSAHDVMAFAYGKVDYFIDLTPGPSPTQWRGEKYKLPFAHNLKENRFRYNPFRNLLIRWILRKYTDERIAISQAHRQALEVNGLSPFRVIYHGFDPEKYEAAPEIIEKLRNRLGLAGKKVIFFGGRLTEGKGSLQMLRALNEVVLQVPEAVLLALSAVPFDRRQLQGLSNIQDKHLCEGGWLSGEELTAAYHVADVVAVPSIYLDPVPTTVFEAMAAGRALVASCYGGSPEVVKEGETGYIVNPFDTTQFASRLTTLLHDETLRHTMGTAARQHMQQHYTFGRQLDEIFKVYESAIQARASKLRRNGAS